MVQNAAEEIRQEDWNGVYYDRVVEGFYILSVNHDEQYVALFDAFTGDHYEDLPFPEFRDSVLDEEFREVSPDVVKNPEEIAEQVVSQAFGAAMSGTKADYSWLSPIDADFISQMTSVSVSVGEFYFMGEGADTE